MKQSYREDIDGLRAIAVLSVVFYHYGVRWVSGGFVGVDVFFVISGYLITKNLTETITSVGFSITDFYHRRIRRIVPAMLFMLGVSIFAGWFLLLPGDYAELGQSAAYSAFGAGNFYFFWHTGYFDRQADMLPLLHMWSLGVEEQFYLVWPALLALLLWLIGDRHIWMVVVISAIIAASLIASAITVPISPQAAFYLPQLRAWELAVGALVVFLPDLKILAEICGLLGLALIAYALFWLTATDPFPGLNAVAPCVGAALIVWPKSSSTRVSRWLSVYPMKLTGLISYSLYLWHWPVLVFFKYYANGELPSGPQAIALGVVAYVLAWLSWRFVERPFRRTRSGAARMIATGVVAASLVFASGVWVSREAGFPSRIPAKISGMKSLETMWAWQCPKWTRLPWMPFDSCRFGAPWDTAKIKAMVIGDSHTQHLEPILQAAAENRPWSFLEYYDCPASLGGHISRIFPEYYTHDYAAHCENMRSNGIRYLQAHPEIDLVIFSASWTWLSHTNLKQDGTLPKDTTKLQMVASDLTKYIEATAAPGRMFIIVADIPQYHLDPVPCAVAKLSGLLRTRCGQLDYVSSTSFRAFQGGWYDLVAQIAQSRKDVEGVYPGNRLCTGEWCQSYLDGEFLYRDGSHLRRNLKETTRRDFSDLIGLTQAIEDASRRGAARQASN